MPPKKHQNNSFSLYIYNSRVLIWLAVYLRTKILFVFHWDQCMLGEIITLEHSVIICAWIVGTVWKVNWTHIPTVECVSHTGLDWSSASYQRRDCGQVTKLFTFQFPQLFKNMRLERNQGPGFWKWEAEGTGASPELQKLHPAPQKTYPPFHCPFIQSLNIGARIFPALSYVSTQPWLQGRSSILVTDILYECFLWVLFKRLLQ